MKAVLHNFDLLDSLVRHVVVTTDVALTYQISILPELNPT